jgi:multidrug efflux pump subunit AcrB
MKRFNLSEWAITHQALVLFTILVLGAAGIYSYLQLGRAEDPSFTIKTTVINVAWPGATATEMQTQVADKIEKKLQELPYLDRVETYSQPGASFVQVYLVDTTPPAKVKELWYQVRKKVGDIKGDLPAGISGPSFNDEYGDVYSAIYMLTADGLSLAELKTRVEDVRQRLLRVPNVNKVDIIGERPQKIFIELSHAKLATLGITPQQIFDSVARQNAVTSGGSVETAADRINLRVTGAFSGIDAIAAVPVQVEGRIFRLGDIATIKRGYEDPPSFIVREGGKPALGLGVSMQDGGNIITLGENLKTAMGTIVAELPVGIEVTQIADQPTIVEHSISEFVETFVEALAIVLLVSFLALGWRAGIVVALSVPLVLSIVLTVMYAAGIDLHRITLGALIIALGLLVDDAIIAIEMIVVKMEQGWSRARAATFAWTSTAFPMLTGTLVTAAGFLPVGFARSSAGEYAGSIFWIVGLALLASWIVAVIFTPYLGLKLLPDLRKPGAHDDPDAIYNTRVYRVLRKVIELALRRRRTVAGVTGLMFAVALVGFPLVQQQFFPTSTRTELFFEMRLPEGTAIGVTDGAARKGESLLAGDPDIETFTTYVGAGSPRFWLGLNRAAECELRPDRHRDEGHRGAGAPTRATRTCARRRRTAGGEGPGGSLQLRAAGRLSGSVPGDWTRCNAGARDRRSRARDHGGQQQNNRPAPQLERAGQVDTSRSRSGPSPCARPHPAGRVADAADAALGLHGHTIPRGDRAHRRDRPGSAAGAPRARPAAFADHHHQQRHCGAAIPGRAPQLRV